MVWYFIDVYIINRTFHGRLEIRNFSSRVEKCFTSERSERLKHFSTLEEKFRISKRPCNILYLSFSSVDVRGAGTRDETLRTSAWEAISSRGFSWFSTFGPALCCQHFLCFILRNRSIQMTVVHVSKACGSSWSWLNKGIFLGGEGWGKTVRSKVGWNSPLESGGCEFSSRRNLFRYQVPCMIFLRP